MPKSRCADIFIFMGKRILFIGPAGGKGALYHGASAKNALIIRGLREAGNEIRVVDTEDKWRRIPLLLRNSVIKDYDAVIVSASRGSAYRFIRVFSKLHPRTPLHYWVIGGILAEEVRNGRFSAQVLSRLSSIITESECMRNELLALGISNTVTVPNFRDTSIASGIDSRHEMGRPFRFVFMSRIDPVKGTNLIFEAAGILKDSGITGFSIDFYGVIEKNYVSEFSVRFSVCAVSRYKGFLDLSDAKGYETLASYDALLFPTVWESEGMAGVIIDSFMAGLPVIASDWRFNSEFINDHKTGLLFTPDSPEALAEAMYYAMTHTDEMTAMRKRCREESLLYDYRKVISHFEIV